jgi:alpha-L-rhamnosidase
MRTLSDNGRADLAYRIATNRDYPSWGYMVENGATTIWELWNGNTADPSMNSMNHVMLLGDLILWYYEYLGAIRNAPSSAGFKQIEMKPLMPEGLDFVNASHHSPYGLIRSEWKRKDGKFTWKITVPCNSSAKIYVPANSKNAVTENGKAFASGKGVRFIGMEKGFALFEIGSGMYDITSTVMDVTE